MKSCIPGLDHKEVVPTYNQSNDKGAVVTEVSNFLLDEEADYLIKKAKENGLQKSTVAGQKGNESSQARTSSTSFLKKNQDDVVSCIEKRIATVAQQPVANLEPLQVTAYSESQEYEAHHDYFHPDKVGVHGQRTVTVFSYLNTVDSGCGGATSFPHLKDKAGEPLKVFPKKGNAVMWSNRKSTGEPNDATLHSGEAVTCAATQKYGLNAWFTDNEWGN
jgi:prolyl 4-hydroxylase